MQSDSGRQDGARWIMAIFFCSGLAALLYQVIWQRALFTIYGTNVESVTIVVTAFLLGLGIGSGVGGRLSMNRRLSPLVLFALFELGIGLFGSVSLFVFRAVGQLTLSLSLAWTGVVTLGLVLLPTVLMGATLPLLVSHGVRRTENVGDSVARMYFINTLGSAVGAFAAGGFLLSWLGLQKTVWLAVTINLGVGLAGLGLWSRMRSAR